jgi:hypothetical protein
MNCSSITRAFYDSRMRDKGWFATLILVQVATVAAMRCATTARPPASPQSLRVREIVVVDDRGVERVRISGHLPDAVVGGKVRPRGDVAAGVVLYDHSGQERGGYITFDRGNQVALTLDNLDGQTALFVAPPHDGSVLRMWRGNDEVAIRSDEDGPRIAAVQNGLLAFQQPPIAAPEKTSICAELRAARATMSDAQVMEYCRRAMPESACRACLEAK